MSKIAIVCLVSSAVGLFVLTVPPTVAKEHKDDRPVAADPVAQIVNRMQPGVCVGQFDRDQEGPTIAEQNTEYLDSVKAAGFKSIRFFYESTRKPEFYSANVRHALDLGLVVNMCMFCYSRDKKDYVSSLKSMAEYYRDYPEELLFEMFNEPELCPKLTDKAQVMEWINEGIAAIRRISPKRIILAGGPAFNAPSMLEKFVTPEYLTYRSADGSGFAEDRYLVGAVHMYEPGSYTMGTKRKKLTDIPQWQDKVDAPMQIAADWMRRWNKRVVVTEWGSYTDPRIREEYLEYTKYAFQAGASRNLVMMIYAALPRNGFISSWNFLDTEFGWPQDVLDIMTGRKAPKKPPLNQLAGSEFAHFNAWGTSNPAAVSIVEDAPLSGRKSLRIVLESDVGIFQDHQTQKGPPKKDKDKPPPMEGFATESPVKPAIHVRNGNAYELTFLARAERPEATVTLQFEDADKDGSVAYTSSSVELATEKKDYRITHLYLGETIRNARVRLLFSGKGNAVTIDRVMLKSTRE
jgi:hypothetical protein